jgi:putative ABC transport system substrate-binding protein
VNVARRQLAALLLLPALPAVWAQSPPRIAWIWPGSQSGELPRSSAFKEGLRENGMVPGQNVVLDERYADGHYDRFPAITDELLARKPAILLVNTIASVRVAQQATRTVPIVFVATNDPLGSGLIASYARPGGNTTGLSTQNEDVVAKHLQLLRELLPQVSRIAMLVNPGNPSGPKLFEHLRASARRFGIDAVAVDVASPQELDAALGTMAQHRPEALLGLPDAMLFSERDRITAFAIKNRIPQFATAREGAVAGALITYGFVQREMFRRAAIYVKKILAGARPADLPVEQPSTFELVINLKTARAIGITIPQELLLRADEVIQ